MLLCSMWLRSGLNTDNFAINFEDWSSLKNAENPLHCSVFSQEQTSPYTLRDFCGCIISFIIFVKDISSRLFSFLLAILGLLFNRVSCKNLSSLQLVRTGFFFKLVADKFIWPVLYWKMIGQFLLTYQMTIKRFKMHPKTGCFKWMYI